MKTRKLKSSCAVIAIPLILVAHSQAALIFQDSYNTSANSLDSRFERASPSPRQSFGPSSNIPSGTQTAGIGVLVPTYSPTQPTDYHDQIRAGQLVLTGDATSPAAPFTTGTQGIATLSPFYNFNHLDTLGNAIATQVAFSLDVFSNSPGAGPDSYSHAAFTVGSFSANGLNGRAESGTAGAGFSVRFVEDRNGVSQLGSFIQLFDGTTLLQNVIANPGGFGAFNVLLDINDTDGNPWDGIGGTTISVSINGAPVGTPFTRGAGGYTSNIMTMEGSANFVGFSGAEHGFDNLQVFSVPEPSAAILGGLGALALLRRRRRI